MFNQSIDFLKSYSDHKSKSYKFSKFIKQISKDPCFSTPDTWKKRFESTSTCGSFLTFGHKSSDSSYNKLIGANFCKYRFCPMCAWRKAQKNYGQTRKMVDFINDPSFLVQNNISYTGKVRYLFLTVTVKNCKIDDLMENIDNLLWSWSHRFMRRKVIKDAVLGAVRHLEVTYNDKNDTFHPHLHSILCVSDKYFSDSYIKTEEYARIFKKCLKLDYTPICDCRAIKGDQIENAVAEVTKYSCKPSDFEGVYAPYVIEALDMVLSGRRIISYSGII